MTSEDIKHQLIIIISSRCVICVRLPGQEARRKRTRLKQQTHVICSCSATLPSSVYVLTFPPTVYAGKRKSVFFCNCFADPATVTRWWTTYRSVCLGHQLRCEGPGLLPYCRILGEILSDNCRRGNCGEPVFMWEKREEIEKCSCMNKNPCNGFSCLASWTLLFLFHFKPFTTCSVFG